MNQYRPMLVAIAGALVLNTASGPVQAATDVPVLEQRDYEAVAAQAEREIKAAGTNGCIAIIDPSGLLLYFKRLDGSMPGCIDAALAKARSSAFYHSPTVVYADAIAKGNTVVLAIPNAVPLGGGYPLKIGESFVGAVGISTPNPNLDIPTAEHAAGVLATQKR